MERITSSFADIFVSNDSVLLLFVLVPVVGFVVKRGKFGLVVGVDIFVFFSPRRFQMLHVCVPVPLASLAPEVYDNGRDYPTYLERSGEFWRELRIKVIGFFGERMVAPPYPDADLWAPCSAS